MCRGLANNYWFQGADGIYTFNWNAHSYVQHPEEQPHAAFAQQLELLREIDDPERMRSLLDWGVDGLFTNRPDRMRQLVDSRGEN